MSSPGRAKQMVWLSGLVSYQEAAEVFERIGHCLIPSTSIWRQHQKYGARLEAAVRRAETQVAPERVILPLRRHDEVGPKGVSMDGEMLNIRAEGWKEFKVGSVFDLELRWQRDERSGEWVQLPHATQMADTAVLGSVSEFSPALWALAVTKQVPHAQDSSVTADGAEWIWNLSDDLFPDSLQIVDWYHARQHLAAAATALFPDDPAHSATWYRRHSDLLFHGGAVFIAAHLEAKGFPEHARYFRTHQRRMQYQQFREEGYPIGSGTVESDVKQFKARLCGPGMRWSRQGAAQMLILRGAVLDHSFDVLWERAA